MMPEDFTIETKVTITLQYLFDLLTAAFEGGSNYWIERGEKINPTEWTFKEDPENTRRYLQEYPLNPGGAVIVFVEDDDQSYRVDFEVLQKGMVIFAEKYPRNFTDFLQGNYDAHDADIYLQCCLFGEFSVAFLAR